MIRRNIEESIRQVMADTPVVLLNGARQTGKTMGHKAAPSSDARRSCALRE